MDADFVMEIVEQPRSLLVFFDGKPGDGELKLRRRKPKKQEGGRILNVVINRRNLAFHYWIWLFHPSIIAMSTWKYAPQPHIWKDLGRIEGCWLRSLSMLYPFVETK